MEPREARDILPRHEKRLYEKVRGAYFLLRTGEGVGELMIITVYILPKDPVPSQYKKLPKDLQNSFIFLASHILFFPPIPFKN